MTSALYPVPMAREEPTKYSQIADDLRARITSGEFPPGARLPSKAQMMERYHVALATVNSAIDILRDEGLAETIQGSGTFARTPAPAGPSEYDRVMTKLDELSGEVRQLEERMSAVERERS